MDFVSIVEFGADPSAIDNSVAFSRAFEKEGSCITVPAGVWNCGPITLKSYSHLHLEKGCIIKFTDDENYYQPVYSRWEGVRCWCMHPCLYSENAENVKITGEGTFDGSGQLWWDKLWEKKKNNSEPTSPLEKKLAELNPDYKSQPGGGGGRVSQFLRPPLVQFNNCKNVELSGVTLTNSPCWTVHPTFSKGVLIDGVTIRNPFDSPNTDAIDIDSCSGVHVRGCNISVGDDGICVKSGSGKDGVECSIPTTDVLVEKCYVESAHGGVVVGSETAAGIRDIEFIDCRFVGTDRGVRIKTRRGRGGHIENIKIRNIDIEGCLCPIAFNMYYCCGTDESWPFDLEKRPVDDTTPDIKNVLIENIRAVDCNSSAGFIVGLPEAVIDNVIIRNCNIKISEKPQSTTDKAEMYRGLPFVENRGIRIRNASVKLENIKVDGTDVPVIYE